MLEAALWAGIGYFLGSVPFGLLLARVVGGVDIRTIGSGNIGATNVLRTGNKWLAATTLLLDAGKGVVAVVVARYFAGECAALAAGAAAFAGHVWPVWLKFRGGKGVATLLGISAALVPWAGLAFAVVWLGVALLSRRSSLGGMAGGFGAALTAWALGFPTHALVLLVLALLVLWTHRSNIARLRAGTEPRIGAGK